MTQDEAIRFISILGLIKEEPVITDEELEVIINLCVRPDANGLNRTSADWIPTYNVYAGLANTWQLKAAKLVQSVSFSADGQQFSLSHRFDHCIKMSEKYKGKSAWSIELQREDIYETLGPQNLATYYVA
jgi:hypothetical protein